MESLCEVGLPVAAVGDKGSISSKDSGEGGSKGASETSGEQVVVKEQVKAVVGNLENVLGELKTVVGDLRVLVNQIDVVTSKIDEEFGEDSSQPYKVTDHNLLVEKRRRSTSLLETGTPKRNVPAFVRHSVCQPYDILTQNKDWVFQPPLVDFTSKVSESSPRHSNCYNRKKDEKLVCHAHNMSNAKLDDVYGLPKKDDIIICTPGSLCYKKDHHGTPIRSIGRRKVDLAIYENVPITTCRTPSKSGSNNSRSPRTSNGSKGHSPRTSNSSGIGNSNESGNGNTYNTKRLEKQHKGHWGSSNKKLNMMDHNAQVDLNNKTTQGGYFQQCDNHRSKSCHVVNKDSVVSRTKQDTQLTNPPQALSQSHRCTVSCSPSPDSDYCGVYERELDLKLELIFEDDLNSCDDNTRTLDLQSYSGYGSTYDRERVSRWAAYTLVNMGSMPMSSDAETPSETSSDILNDNIFITTAAEMGRRNNKPWASVFNRYYKHGLEGPDKG